MILLLLLLHVSCMATVYNVTPVSRWTDPNPDYYFNTIKDIVSNTHLHFLRGTHELHTHFMIENVDNVSLTGEVSLAYKKPSTIHCFTSSVNIIFSHITNLQIQNIIFSNCQTQHLGFLANKFHMFPNNWVFMIIHDCYDVSIVNMTIKYDDFGAVSASLILSNVLGKSVISGSSSNQLSLIYTDLKKVSNEQEHELIVRNYDIRFFDYEFYEEVMNILYNHEVFSSRTLPPAISLTLNQSSYRLSLKLVNTTFLALIYNKIISVTSFIHKANVILIENCIFQFNLYSISQVAIIAIEQSVCKSSLEGSGIIEIYNCTFTNNECQGSILVMEWIVDDCLIGEEDSTKPKFIINHCLFENNTAVALVGLKATEHTNIVLHIHKTIFINFKEYNYEPPWPSAAIIAENIKLFFSGAVHFHEVFIKYGLLHTNEDIFISNNMMFSNIKALNLINGSTHHKVTLVDNALVNITRVKITQTLFSLKNRPVLLYLPCYFQYQRKQHNNQTVSQKIVIDSENIKEVFDTSTANINCRFQQYTEYHGLNPLKVYLKHVKVDYNGTLFNTGFLCYCLGMKPNCYTNTLGSIYPGQNLTLHVSLNPNIIKDKIMSVSTKNSVTYESVCRVSSPLEAEQYVERKCTAISYTIVSDGSTHCKLFLYSGNHLTIYFIKLLKCPVGFSLSTETLSKRCICDPILVVNKITQSCDINDQTILRPASSWMSAIIHNNSYTYHTSLQCPFHYCLPYSSHLNLSTPNSQCQFNRSGLLCGHCQYSLSTVFSSSHCKSCTNIYLLLVIPIILIGIVLVLLLFFLNLTVTDGAINGFILYANIISINTPVFFPNINIFTPSYTFVSLANLDLGIQTCFYNGMDDYAKMWLQLAFPFYLIFIATLIIITSRYSTTIQRLTARRALPVLATLFLLSYTKILRIVSSVLFFYSTIIHLPSKHTTLVWSVDANVPLFGVRFTILFIVCLILFLILIPFNVILLFTRTLSRFQFINKFKPLLDAYQGPYKIKFYYWTGLQLLIRAVFFGTSSLDRNLNLTIGIALFSLIGSIQGFLKPFKNELKSFQEQALLINITILYALLLYNQETLNPIAVSIMITLAAVHFSLIIAYHIITYVCSAAIKQKINSNIKSLANQFAVFTRKSQTVNHFQLQDNIRCNIPEAVNYHDFQEPLLNY